MVKDENIDLDEKKRAELWDKKFQEAEKEILPENYKFLKRHIRELKNQGRKPRTIINHQVLLIPLAKWCKKPLNELNYDDICDYFDTLTCKAESTIQNHKTTIRTFLMEINQDVALRIKTKRHRNTKTPDELLTDKDVEKLISCCENSRDKALVACLMDSGARIGELLSTQIQDAKFDNDGCLLWLRKGKSGPRHARLICASSYIRAWLDVHPRRDDKKAPIFCSLREPYNLISNSGLYEQLVDILKRSGINKHINPHNFRHSRATDLAKKLKSEQKLKAIMGWKPSSSMASVYIHLSGIDISNAILEAEGIKSAEEEEKEKPRAYRCPRCKEMNSINEERCLKCGFSEKDPVLSPNEIDDLITQKVNQRIEALITGNLAALIDSKMDSENVDANEFTENGEKIRTFIKSKTKRLEKG
jgi:integrase/recombinase XerD